MPEQKDTSAAEYNEATSRFIDLANKMKAEGTAPNVVNAALMSASCVYATYVAAGNVGYLKQGGIDKVTETYRANLSSVQELKKRKVELGASEPGSPAEGESTN